MKIKLLIISLLIVTLYDGYSKYDPMTVELTRLFSKEIFEENGIKYLQPLAAAMNSTSNARFFNRAYVPKRVKTPYFRLSLNGMLGFVREDQKSYIPMIPSEPFDTAVVFAKLNEMGKLSFDFSTMKYKYAINPGDTSKLMAYIFKLYMGEALRKKIIKLPETSPTVLGKGQPIIHQDKQMLLDSVVHVWPTVGFGTFQYPIYSFLDTNVQKSFDAIILNFPNYFSLPAGGNFNTLFAGIPQLEFGSLFGTEALVRFIPPVKMDDKIGKFAFWGIGLKHSISQYFGETGYFDMAAQIVYQGTYLKNSIKESGAELDARADIWDFNIQISKNFWNSIDFYTGLSYDILNINTNYKYFLPVEVQFQLGLLELREINGIPTIMPPDPANGYPGDTKPNFTTINLRNENIKWIIGARGTIGPFALYIDYSVSKFNIFSSGFEMDLNRIYQLFKGENFFNDGNYIVN